MQAMLSDDPAIYSVSALTVYIRQMFDLDYRMQDVWVEGEISNFSQPASGHWYFTLKDERSQLKGVMWKTSVAQQDYVPQHGEKIVLLLTFDLQYSIVLFCPGARILNRFCEFRTFAQRFICP